MFKKITTIINEITSWKNDHPGAYFHKVYSAPRKLQYIIEAVADDGTHEGINRSFVIPLSSITRDRISSDQFRVFMRYLDACQEKRGAEREFIKIFTSEIN